MAVRIGAAVSLADPLTEEIIPDDRQEKIEMLNGCIVQDFGRCESGDVLACELTFDDANWQKILQYWTTREQVLVSRKGIPSFFARVVVKRCSILPRFPHAKKANLEFWRV